MPCSRRVQGQGAAPSVTYRRQGDKYLLVEYGPIVLDFELRFRVHALMTRLEAARRLAALSI